MLGYEIYLRFWVAVNFFALNIMEVLSVLQDVPERFEGQTNTEELLVVKPRD